jgi:peptidoglycan/xylan/chitin deacetylase (PgdA/CDA1 family)
LEFSPQNKPRQLVRWIWIYFLYLSGSLARARRNVAKSGGIIVLTLHRVLDDTELAATNSPVGMIVRKKTFEHLLQFLKKHFDVLPLSHHPPSWDSDRSRLRLAVTFDDGWKDSADNAFPLAEEYGIPITVFICPGLAGKASPFWPETLVGVWQEAVKSPDLAADFLQVCKAENLRVPNHPWDGNHFLESLLVQLKSCSREEREQVVDKLAMLGKNSPRLIASAKTDSTMSWEDTTRIAARGAQIGSHTHTHQILTTIPLADVASEMEHSNAAIKSNLGVAASLFAYPNGSWSPQVRELVAKAGFTRAFANAPGIWNQGTDQMVVPRVNLWEGSLTAPDGTFSDIAFQYAVIWRSYRAHR